jgi:hypothetical protein
MSRDPDSRAVMTQAAERLLAEPADVSLPRRIDGGGLRVAPGQSRFDLMLASGGDASIWPDPATRRNRYGAPTRPAPDELWFSSATGAAISERGYASARSAFESLSRKGADLPAWFDAIRERIATQFGAPGVEVALAASPAEAEYAALAVARALLARPVASILTAPQETSAGVALAATGAHIAASAPFAASVEKGARLAGWEEEDIVLRRIEIRDASGRPRPRAEVDRAAGLAVANAVRTGRGALLHLVDCSATGRSGPSRATAREILESASGRALVVVDSCQLRGNLDQIRSDLAAGFLVMVAGSKFAGGPSSCAALLIPADMAARLREMRLPIGLAAYVARNDWPRCLANAFDDCVFPLANLGLGLRWEAALAEIEAYAKISPPLKEEIAARFAESARRCVAGNPDLDFLDSECWRLGKPATVFPILTQRGDPAQARLIFEALRADSAGLDKAEYSKICHLSEPLVVGGRAALRLCYGMPHANAVAERVARGEDLESAFRPLRADMELLFRKWGALAKRIGAGGPMLAAANA